MGKMDRRLKKRQAKEKRRPANILLNSVIVFKNYKPLNCFAMSR